MTKVGTLPRLVSCVALTQVECNLPAIYSSDSSDCVSRDSRSRTWTFQGGRRGKNIPRYYSTFPPLLPPSLLFTQENFLPRNKFDCRFQATLGLENNCPRWRTVARKKLRNSRGNKAVRPLFEMGKACFSRRSLVETRPKTRRKPPTFRAFSTTLFERASGQSASRWQSGLPLDKCRTLYGCHHRGPPKWFS